MPTFCATESGEYAFKGKNQVHRKRPWNELGHDRARSAGFLLALSVLPLINLPPSLSLLFLSMGPKYLFLGWGVHIAPCLSPLTPVHIQAHHYSENPAVQKKFLISPQIHLLLKLGMGWGAVAVLNPPPGGVFQSVHPPSASLSSCLPVSRATESPGSGSGCVSLPAWSLGDSSKGIFHFLYSCGSLPLPQAEQEQSGVGRMFSADFSP